VTSDTSQLEGKKGIEFSIAPPEVTSSPQRSHPKQASETQIPRNFRNNGPKLFKVSEIRTQVPEGKRGIGFSVGPPEVTSPPQRSHPKQATETHILRNFRNTGPKFLGLRNPHPRMAVQIF